MSLRCKPGQLAVILRDPYPENVNRVVQVLYAVSRECDPPHGHTWLVSCLTPLAVGWWDHVRGCIGPAMHYSTEAGVLDSDLQPINDPGIDVSETTDEPIKEAA